MFADSFDLAMTLVLDVCQFVQCSDNRSDCVPIVIGRPVDPSEGRDLQGSLL